MNNHGHSTNGRFLTMFNFAKFAKSKEKRTESKMLLRKTNSEENVSSQATFFNNSGSFGKRFFWTLMMLIFFSIILISGYIGSVLLVICIQMLVFNEVMNTFYMKYSKDRKMLWNKFLTWYGI